MAHPLITKAYRLTKQILPNEAGEQIDLLLKKAKRVFDADAITQAHLAQHSGARLINKPAEFLAAVFGIFYGKYASNTIVPGGAIALAQSWVPYRKGITEIVLYNFFGRNYGVRDPIYYRLVLLSDGKPLQVQTLLLPSDAVYKPDFSSLWDQKALPDLTTLLVQAYHPRIKTLRDQLRYFVLYRNPTHGLQCAIHSMSISKAGIELSFRPNLRSYAPSSIPLYYYTAAAARDPMATSAAIPGDGLNKKSIDGERPGLGYLMADDADGFPAAVWHDGPTSHRVTKAPIVSKKTGSCKTAFCVPDFEIHAPIILVSTEQIGYQVQELRIRVYDVKNQLLAEKKVSVPGETAGIDLRKIFEAEKFHGFLNFEVDFQHDFSEFENTPPCMLHLYYRSKAGYGDQVHSHYSFGFSNDTRPKLKSYRCRKFAPLILEPGLKFTYSIVNIGSDVPNRDTSVKLRILTDRGAEAVVKVPLPSVGLGTVSGDELLDAVKGDISSCAVVLMEHETTNFAGTYMFVNRNAHLGVDHFTGG